MRFELRKVHLSKQLSEETPAYTAQVWVDNVHVCDVKNDGHGGCDYQYPAKGKTHADINALNAKIKATYPKQTYTMNGEEHSYDTDLEHLCQEELFRLDLMKMFKRDLSRKLMFVKADGKLYQINVSKVSYDRRCKLIDDLRNAGHKVLNEMTINEAAKIYEKWRAS